MLIKTRIKLLYVAQVHSNFPSKWANNFQVMKMCSAFSANNIDTTLLVPFNQKTKDSLKRIKPIIWDFYGVKERFRINWIKFYYPNIKFKLFLHGIIVVLFLARTKYNLVYTRSEWVGIFTSFLLTTKVCLELHNYQNSFSQKILIKLSSINKNLSLVCISRALKNQLIKSGYNGKILVAHDGVDLEYYSIKTNKKYIREKYGLPYNKPVVAHIGSISEGRGFRTIIKTAKNMNDVYFYFVYGHDADLDIINDTKKERILNVRMLDFLPNLEIPDLLKASDILLMTYTSRLNTLRYTSPLKMFEYMASNVPIISSDFPVLREVLNEKNALLIPSSDSNSLQAAINTLLNEKSYASSLAKQAYNDVKSFTWNNRAKKIIRFIESKT